MFLTRMQINTRRRGAMKLLASPQAMHAAVQSGFPPGSLDTAGGRALWRIDRNSNDDVALFLASPIEPDLSHLVEQAGWQSGEMWQTRDYQPLLHRLTAGQRWTFRLTANPVFHGIKKGKDWTDTKPLAHVTSKQQESWLLDRSERLGFHVQDGPHDESALRIVGRSTLRFSKGGHRVVIGTATFEGILKVTDPVALSVALTHGVGRAKAYGCGLLTLAPTLAGG